MPIKLLSVICVHLCHLRITNDFLRPVLIRAERYEGRRAGWKKTRRVWLAGLECVS